MVTKNILFVCMANLHRSRTAELHFQTLIPRHVFRSAGLSPVECTRNGGRLLCDQLLSWADEVYVMERVHYEIIESHAPSNCMHKVHVLNVPDRFKFMQPELVAELNMACRQIPSFSALLKD